MLVEIHHQLWLVVRRHILPEEVSVELGILSSKLIRLIFVVVGNQVSKKFRSHMRMIRAWSHSRVKHRSHVFVALTCYTPARENDHGEVS